MNRDELDAYLNRFLEVPKFQDYCPNGLQVEGRAEIRKIVSGVSASLALLEAAVAADADAVLVHHGYFWKSEEARLTGTRRRRIALILEHDLNLFAYHLPLDAHPVIGNNIELARRLGFEPEGWFGEQNTAAFGRLSNTADLGDLARDIGARLEREPLVVGDLTRQVSRIAWCTGAAQGYFDEAVKLGVDVYLTGEVSEQTVHLARESGVAFIAAGHHATERYGVQALGRDLAQRFGLEHRFIDIPNPV